MNLEDQLTLFKPGVADFAYPIFLSKDQSHRLYSKIAEQYMIICSHSHLNTSNY